MTFFLTWDLIQSFDIVIKSVITFISLMSIFSWAIFLQKFFLFRKIIICNNKFLQHIDNHDLLTINSKKSSSINILNILKNYIFVHVQKNLIKNDQYNSNKELYLKTLKLNIKERIFKIQANLEKNIFHLATIASISPFIGLFGTVWGIMNSLHITSNIHDLHEILPAISETLLVTALGLVAAIPAIIFYNKLMHDMRKIQNDLTNFVEKILLEVARQC